MQILCRKEGKKWVQIGSAPNNMKIRVRDGLIIYYEDPEGKLASKDYIVDEFELNEEEEPIGVRTLKETPCAAQRKEREARLVEYNSLIDKPVEEFVLADYQRCEQLKRLGI